MTAPSGTRDRIIGRIADHLVAIRPGHPLRVAVDGVTAAGKTTLAAEVSAAVASRGRPATHLSMDGFHHPRAHRHRQGRESASGYYEDAYDFHAFTRVVLTPLGPGGDRRYRAAVLDLASDEPVDAPPVLAEPDEVLVVDGSFLQRAELAGSWDEVLFVDTDLDVARDRGSRRDAAQFGGVEAARHAYESRYHAACRRYLAELDPAARASIVLGNDDVDNPSLHRIGGTATDTVELFSYGTLQLPQVQLAQFGRRLEGRPEALPGYRTEWLKITDAVVIAVSGSDTHPVVRRSAQTDAAVDGTVFRISPIELAAADLYEVEDYRRHQVRLGGGTSAWVYLDATN